MTTQIQKHIFVYVTALSTRRIKDKFLPVFSKFSQHLNFCQNFENTSENVSLILLGLSAITCL